ncbi:MAG TPA: hypothetical protein VLJ58_06735 [Ramlibacter sp.]|nr:hypothetical protein [Ramlibacter sp.]
MPTLLSFLLRLFLLAAGLVFALSLAVAFVLMLALWTLRAAWARLTGKPATPFVMRFRPGEGFDRMARRGPQTSRTPRADAVPAGRRMVDVTDVDPK